MIVVIVVIVMFVVVVVDLVNVVIVMFVVIVVEKNSAACCKVKLGEVNGKAAQVYEKHVEFLDVPDSVSNCSGLSM